MMSSEIKYRSDIDGLRAIAVFIVVAYHALIPGFTGGFIGVDVFFVISGFLITGLLFKEAELSGTINLLNFYAKRFKRLYPALLFLIVILIFIWALFFVEIPANTTLFIRSIQYSIFGFGNIFFKNNTGGYFDLASDEMPLLHFWSLGVEEQFYFVWPFLLITCAKFNFKNLSLHFKTVMALTVLSIVAFCYSEYLVQHDLVKEAFYIMPARAWELSIGGLLFFIYPKLKLNGRTANYISIIGISGIIVCTYWFNSETRFPGMTALIPVLCTSLIILSGGRQSRLIDQILVKKSLVRLGILSYGWYLWHWPLLAFLRLYYLGEIPPIYYRFIAIVISLFMAYISLEFIEKPVRYGKKINQLSSKKVILTSLIMSFVLVFLSHKLKYFEKFALPKDYQEIAKYLNSVQTENYGCDGSPESARGKKCIADFSSKSNRRSKEVFIWGDSHATSYFPLFENLAKEENLKIYLVSDSDMSPLLGVNKVYFSSRPSPKTISTLNQKIYQNIKRSVESHNEVSVVLISRWSKYTGERAISVKDDIAYLDSKDPQKSLAKLKAGLENTISSLAQVGVKRILLFLPTPEFKYKVVNCFKAEACDTPLSKFESYRSNEVSIINEVAKEYEAIKLLDPVRTYCSALNCPQIIYNDMGIKIPVVTDDDHVSSEAALYLGRKEKNIFLWVAGKSSKVPVK